jgi:hypothetical protein
MIDELEIIWKDAIVIKWKHLPGEIEEKYEIPQSG